MKPVTRRIAILAALILLIGGLLQFSGALPAAASFTARVSEPIIRPVRKTAIGVKNLFGTLFRIRDLARQNSEIKNRLAELSGNAAELAEFKKENDALKKQLGISETRAYALLPARIISSAGTGYEGTLVLDRGERDGVKKDMFVVFESNLVGKIRKTNLFTSELELVTSPNSVIVGQVPGRDATGVVKGQIGAGVLGLRQVELGKKIRPGDIVSSAKISSDTPPGLVLGLIENVEANDNAVFQSATVRPILDFDRLVIVFIAIRER